MNDEGKIAALQPLVARVRTDVTAEPLDSRLGTPNRFSNLQAAERTHPVQAGGLATRVLPAASFCLKGSRHA